MYSDGESQEIKEQLAEVTKLARENNKIMRKVQRSMRASLLFRVIYWVAIIGSMFGAYYYLQPFMDTIKDQYNELISIPDTIKDFNLPF